MLVPKIHVGRFTSGNLEIHIPNQCLQMFKEMVQRATNLWPDAPPDIKNFADNITNDGVIMQDYSKATVTNQLDDWVCLVCGSRTKNQHGVGCPNQNNQT